MPPNIPGLHHVTATAADAREDLAFYTALLGLRLVKKTVNFDNPGVYHFYYGNEIGTPSTLMTTFPYAGQGVPTGTRGAGQITVVSFSVPRGALGFWQDRLASARIGFEVPGERFGEGGIVVQDPSGSLIELRESDNDARVPWVAENIDPEAAIRGLHGVTLLVRDSKASIEFLTAVLGFAVADRVGPRVRMSTGDGGAGTYLEVVEAPDAPAAVNGMGTVHHVALAVAGPREQLAIREELVRLGHRVTEVRDRQYFQSIYFREPGGVLYEVATVGPGFAVDESIAELGSGLKLPPWEEENRVAIEAALPSVSAKVAGHG